MSEARPGFSFLICPDGRLLRSRLEGLLAGCPPPAGRWERHVYWGDEPPPPRFWEQISLQGLFGTPRVIVARQAHLWGKDIWEKLSRALGRPSAQCWPVLCLEKAWERGQPRLPAWLARLPCMAFAEKRGWVWRKDALSERAVAAHVQGRARELHLPFEPDALRQLCASVPPDAQAIENELEKLRLLRAALADADGGGPAAGRVTTAMTATAAWSPEGNVFACIRHMEAGNLPAVWKELSRSPDGDGLLFSLLALLARELRLLWLIQAGASPSLRPNEAAPKRALAARLGRAGVADGMAAVMEAEWRVKSGRATPRQSLEWLACHMTGLCAPRPGARG